MARVKTRKTSFSLEEYEFFLENPFMSRFSIAQLNQIMVFDAISTIDLVKPHRSTLKDNDDHYGGAYNIHAGDFSLSPGQVKRDLEDLKWQECYIHTMDTVGPAAKEKNRVPNVSAPKDLLASMASPVSRRRRQKRKRRHFGNGAVEEDPVVAGGDDLLGVQEGAVTAAAAAAAVKVEAEAGCTSLYVDTYHWGL
ncbi:hypothetical protein LINGRAHAP2_LOCUS6205 [Linum grandiflorum]